MKKIIKISFELEVGDRFITNDNTEWLEKYRNAEFIVSEVDEFGCYIIKDDEDAWFDNDDINWEETIKLNEIKENDYESISQT